MTTRSAPGAAMPTGPTTKKVPRYKLLYTGNLDNAASTPVAINCQGSFAGNSTTLANFNYHAFIWRGGLTDIGTFGGDESKVAGLNDSDQVVGTAALSHPTSPSDFMFHNFLWDPNRGLVDLSTAPSGVKLSTISGIDDNGVLLGTVGADSGSVLWKSGKVVGTIGDAKSYGQAMNGAGQVLVVNTQGGSQYLRDPNGATTEVAGSISRFGQLSSDGRFAGSVPYTGTYARAGVWDRKRGVRDIGWLPGAIASYGLGVNSSGQVVGVSYYQPGSPNFNGRAFLWEESTGKMVDLNDEIAAASGFELLKATCINDRGWIAGVGRPASGLFTAYLLVPTGIEWGAMVKVALTDGSTLQDYLVAYEPQTLDEPPVPARIVLQQHLSVVGETVTESNPLPMDKVQSIEVAQPAQGFNTYIGVFKNTKGVTDAKTVAINSYRGGSWSYEIHSISGHSIVRTPKVSPLLGLYGIPRSDGHLSDPATVKQAIDAAGTQRNIPPQILYAVAWQESGATHRWQQFQLDKPSCRIRTVVTFDGGIGLFQLTHYTALYGANPSWDGNPDHIPADSLTHLYRLSSDLAANVAAGALVLRAKFMQNKPKLGQRDPSYVEHWYQAVGRYNGAGAPYADSVWGFVKAPPYAPSLKIQPVEVTTPGNEAPPTTFPAHGDGDFDGNIDVVLSNPQATVSGSTVTVSVTVQPLQMFAVYAVQASIVGPGGPGTPAALTQSGGRWSGTIPAKDGPPGGGVPAVVSVPGATFSAAGVLIRLDVLLTMSQPGGGSGGGF